MCFQVQAGASHRCFVVLLDICQTRCCAAAAWPNLIDVRLGRDGDGQSKGFAFLVGCSLLHQQRVREIVEMLALEYTVV